MKKFLMAAATVACLVATPAMARDMGLYGSVGLSHVDADIDVSFEALTGRLGARFTPNLAVEGEGSFGFEQDDLDGVNYELTNDFGIYGVVLWPMTDNADLLLRVGTGTSQIEVGGEDVDNNGVRYGAGAQFFFNAVSGVRIDLTRFNLDDDVDADVYTVSYVHKFGG
jgi:outer membrane immunogenic protein